MTTLRLVGAALAMICLLVGMGGACRWIAPQLAVSGCDRTDHRLDTIRNDEDAAGLVGIPRDALTQRFGAPNSHAFAPRWDAAYRMRTVGSCSNSLYLVLDFDETGRVVDAKVLTLSG